MALEQLKNQKDLILLDCISGSTAYKSTHIVSYLSLLWIKRIKRVHVQALHYRIKNNIMV